MLLPASARPRSAACNTRLYLLQLSQLFIFEVLVDVRDVEIIRGYLVGFFDQLHYQLLYLLDIVVGRLDLLLVLDHHDGLDGQEGVNLRLVEPILVFVH